MPRAASYIGLRPASATASRAARASSAKRDNQPELLLRKALRARGISGYRVAAADLPGKPDVVFRGLRVAIFCDGDFWHGRDLSARLERLATGHNAPYWVRKIEGNVARDRRQDADLAADGWTVLRYWETDIRRDAARIAHEIGELVSSRRGGASR